MFVCVLYVRRLGQRGSAAGAGATRAACSRDGLSAATTDRPSTATRCGGAATRRERTAHTRGVTGTLTAAAGVVRLFVF